MKKHSKATSIPTQPARSGELKNMRKKAGSTRRQPRESAERIETDPALNNEESTAGTGMLPPIGDDDPNAAPSG
jgi:hypothetical protein